MFGEIKNQAGEKIDYAFHPGASGARFIMVLGHGVTGNKDRPFLVALADGLSAAGIPALRFSFSGNGASGGRFAESTVTKEVADLGCVLDALRGWQVGYAGHSMGGAVGVIRASRDRRIEQLISLAGMVDTAGFSRREFGSVRPGEGFMWDEPGCPLSQAYVDDMNRIGTVLGCADSISVPWLLVHGTEDDVVPIQDSRDIFAKAREPKKLVELPGANHVFAGAAIAALVQAVTSWLRERAGGQY